LNLKKLIAYPVTTKSKLRIVNFPEFFVRFNEEMYSSWQKAITNPEKNQAAINSGRVTG
jgi:hypothetical protein